MEAVRASLDFGAFTDWLCAPLADGGMNLARAEADAALLQLLRFLELKARTRKTRIGSVTASCVSYLTCASLHRTQAAFKDFDATAFSCSAFLDEVWHALLLRPVLYAAVCAQLAGQLLDHNPGAAAASLAHSRVRAQRLAHTRRAYAREYDGEPPPMWCDEYEPRRNQGGFLVGSIYTRVRARRPGEQEEH